MRFAPWRDDEFTAPNMQMRTLLRQAQDPNARLEAADAHGYLL